MSVGKVQFTLGNLSFSGEGEESWVSTQLDKILTSIPQILHQGGAPKPLQHSAKAHEKESGPERPNQKESGDPGTLASFLKAHSALQNQNRKFLAAAKWLHGKGSDRLTTRQVSAALAENHQKKPGNPSQCVASLTRSGYLQAVGKEFYVTPEGTSYLERRDEPEPK